MGAPAASSVSELIKALNDSEAYVRAPAADALGSIGPAASGGVQALIDRTAIAGEQAFVLRSVVAALGNIGPNATNAIPVLRQMLKMHRVAYTAQEAILKIDRQPVPQW
jgi:HEAT repeat protein